VVEGCLYEFGKSCIGGHPSRSLIIDISDGKTYVENKIFTRQELEEIKAFNDKQLYVTLPCEIKEHLNIFSCDFTERIRSSLNSSYDWETNYNRDKSFDLDWIKRTIYTLARLYEDGSLNKDHLEQWYNIHVWSFIDRLFENIEGLGIIR
jgi:hypothetical protein